MAFEIEVKGKPVEIKFDYRTVFKANKQLGSKDENGNINNDGAFNLFTRITDQEDEAVFDLVKLGHKGKALTEDDLFDAVENYIENYDGDESEAYDALFTEIKQEMLDSGFFVKKLKKQLINLEKGKEIIEQREDEESQIQAKAISDLIDSVKKELS